MPIHKCGSSSLCLHELASIKEDEYGDYEYVEVDPSGRYGRVNKSASFSLILLIFCILQGIYIFLETLFII